MLRRLLNIFRRQATDEHKKVSQGEGSTEPTSGRAAAERPGGLGTSVSLY